MPARPPGALLQADTGETLESPPRLDCQLSPSNAQRTLTLGTLDGGAEVATCSNRAGQPARRGKVSLLVSWLCALEAKKQRVRQARPVTTTNRTSSDGG